MFVSDGMSGIFGIRIVSELCKSITLASVMLRCSHATVSRVPLNRPFESTKFLSNIITAPGSISVCAEAFQLALNC